MKCPCCGGKPARIYKCSQCGEVRCGQQNCKGSKDGPAGWAGPGTMCRSCGDGRYEVLGFFSREMDEIRRSMKEKSDAQF